MCRNHIFPFRSQQWPPAVISHMGWCQQELEEMHAAAKKRLRQSRPSCCMYCGVLIKCDMYRHVARFHLDLAWRCPDSGASPLVLDGVWDVPDDIVRRREWGPDFTPAYGVHLHDPRLLEYVRAPESARLLSRSPEYWLHHLGHEKTLAAALQLQHDAGLILSNVQVLQQLVTAFNKTSSEVMQVAFGQRPFPADAMQYVVPSYRVCRVAHYMAAMGLWRPPITQDIREPLPSATCNACMSCNDCFPTLPQ